MIRKTNICIIIIIAKYFYLFTIINSSLFCRYNVQWYVAPLYIQKMMLFLLQRGTKAFHMILGRIFVASMENAAAVRCIYHIL